MSAIDWNSVKEPWRAIGLDWCGRLAAMENSVALPPAPIVPKTFDEVWLNESLKSSGISGIELARALSITDSMVSRWRLGKKPISPARRLQMEAIFADLQKASAA
jgi:hypothetical protein